MKKMVKERSRNKTKASAPRILAMFVSVPLALGGVSGRKKLSMPRTAEAEYAQDGRSGCGHLERKSQLFGGYAEYFVDQQAGGNPADGAQYADGRELLTGVLHLAEGNGIGQGQGGGVQQGIKQQDPVECIRVPDLREVKEQGGADKVQDAEYFLRGEEPVCDHAHEERGDDGSDGHGAIGCAHLYPCCSKHLIQVGAHRHVPAAPDKKLEEHHYTQSCSCHCVHMRSLVGGGN